MSVRAKRPCRHAGCPNTTSERYCEQHAKHVTRIQEKDASVRDAELRRFYNSAVWKHTRLDVLRDNPLCSCKQPATQVHHTKDAFDYADLRLDRTNLVSICASCHSKETAHRNRMKGKRW